MDYDINKENQKKEKKFNYESKKDEINKFFNKIEYKTKLFNIDSSYRNKIPKNIYTSENNFLVIDALQTTINSNIVKIYYPNSNFAIDDRIIIQNVEGPSKTLINALYFFNNYSYMFIQYTNHGLMTNYLNYIDSCQISISLNETITTTSYGNIPINAITGIFDVYLPSLINKTTPILPETLLLFNANVATDLDKDYLLIQLPFTYYGTTNYFIVDNVFKFNILSIGGIPITYINSDYPINYQRYQGYQQIINVDDTYIYIQTSIIASFTTNGGGSKIQIMKITNTLPGYPDANRYTIDLNHCFNNVVRIELVSTEIPNIDYLIKSFGSKQNNKLYWKQYDDGNTIYQMLIPEGNYDSSNLISIITTNINKVTRITSTKEKPVYNIFIVNLNVYTQELTFTAYKNNNLPNSLTSSIVTINNIQYVKITVYHPSNLVQLGDTIIISNSDKIGTIITTNYINTQHTIYEINITEQTYAFLVAPLNELTNLTQIDITGTGGPSIVIQTKAKVSFLFNYSDTLGNVLGFKNVGEPNAITAYNTTISNFDSYPQSTELNQVGTVNSSNQIINLTGSDYYYLMYINNYELVINNSNQPIAFAKILLSGLPNDILFNTFINYPLEFDFPIATLDQITVSFTYPDGTLVDFRNINHSFTLRIIEQVKIPFDTNLNSKEISFLDVLKN